MAWRMAGCGGASTPLKDDRASTLDTGSNLSRPATMTAVWHLRPLTAFSAQTGGVVCCYPCNHRAACRTCRSCSLMCLGGYNPVLPGASLPWPVRMLRHSRAGRASGAGGGADHAGRTGAAGHQGCTDVLAVGVRQAEVVKRARVGWSGETESVRTVALSCFVFSQVSVFISRALLVV